MTRRIDKRSTDESDQSPAPLFVTDSKGNILISNEFTALTIGIPLEELLRYNVQDLVKAGYYKESITMKAIQSKQKVTQYINTVRGFKLKSTALPILDSTDEVQLVVTSTNNYKGGLSIIAAPTLPHGYENSKRSVTSASVLKNNGIIAESLAMKQIIQVCDQIASYDSKVLILGESGTGKSVIAKYIHRQSAKWNGPFIPINSAAIPAALFEYELFGYVQGAMPGLMDEKQGLFEVARGGVLFFDEVAELPLEIQAKLLDVLERGEFRRVGSTEAILIQCRMIFATNRDLWSMVKKGLFREDLYYRINVIPIHIPPLRSRRLDLVGLISSFIAHFNKVYDKKYVLPADEFQRMLAEPWHGNARELRNYIERLIVTDQTVLRQQQPVEQVTDWFTLDHFIQANRSQLSGLKEYTALTEGRYIQQMLQVCGGNSAEAARQLGIDRSAVYRKLKKMEDILAKLKV
ncbi:sigma-54-dependent Fis family transcriptional regulator [Paenibacillus polymyxa]|uniref:sigma-54 interaction domain-containing protein n=1 Tax=Paenibacillus TaxID=44249 RepID=UPI0008FC78E3|nr:sigma 54-interacting transcriptional regulator [Paenibacillus polymyxa]APB71082.1 sigma-54-dependent Fis family transcriptional regulator [Paenibacillus polymyxa]